MPLARPRATTATPPGTAARVLVPLQLQVAEDGGLRLPFLPRTQLDPELPFGLAGRADLRHGAATVITPAASAARVAARCRRTTGTGRRAARRGGPRGSPTPPATARAPCRRRRRPPARWSSSSDRSRRCRARRA